jgi:hypothetical protein
MRFAGLYSAVFLAALSTLQATPTTPTISVPIRFEQNRGQVQTTAKEPVEWVARGVDYSYLFTRSAAVLHFDKHSYRMHFSGANGNSHMEGIGPVAGTTKYVTPAFHGVLNGYQRLVRKDLYPGVDVVYYGNGNRLEYDFEVAPGADPSKIRFRFEGTGSVRLNEKGDLILGSDEQTLTQRAPVVYQQMPDGQRRSVSGEYKMDKNGWITVSLGNYNRSAKLIIDPDLIYTSYLFGTKTDSAIAVAHDNQGFVYVAGNTLSTDFTVTDAHYAIATGGQDVWFSKMNPKATDGNFTIYTTYYGGGGTDTLRAMAVDPVTGKVYLTGITTSTNLPLLNAYQTSNTGTDLFVAAFDPTQAGTTGLLYATLLGGIGNEDVRSIAEKDGKAYILGNTSASTYPVVNAFASSPEAGSDIILSVIDTTQTGTASLAYSTYFTGVHDDYARSLAVDSTGIVYIAGLTYSPDIPVTQDGFQTAYNNGGEIFVFKFDITHNTVLWGTYLGGSGLDDPKKMIVEPSGRIALTGFTMSTDFPITQNAYQSLMIQDDPANAFLAILDPSVQGQDSLVYSTYFGGGEAEVAYDLARDIEGKYYLGGYTYSGRATSPAPLPISNDALNQVSSEGAADGFFAVIDTTTGINGLVYSTYITSKGNQIVYGLDVDIQNTAYVVGTATSDIFPAGQAAKQTKKGNIDGFFAAFQFTPPPQELIDKLFPPTDAAATDAQTSTDGSSDATASAQQ